MQASYSDQYRDLWARHWWWQARHQVVMRKLAEVSRSEKRNRADLRLLDIGCAGGVAFDDFSQFGQVSGIEPDRRLIDPHSPWAAHIDECVFDNNYKADNQFDVILMLDVLEHIEDDAGALACVFELLRPGASAILTVPALPSLWSVHDEVNHHFRRYTRASLVNRLAAAGFEFAEVRYMFGWSLALMYLRRMLTSRNRQSYGVSVPPAVVNCSFSWMSRMEEFLCRTVHFRMPLGSSLLAIARRPTQNSGTTQQRESGPSEEVRRRDLAAPVALECEV